MKENVGSTIADAAKAWKTNKGDDTSESDKGSENKNFILSSPQQPLPSMLRIFVLGPTLFCLRPLKNLQSF